MRTISTFIILLAATLITACSQPHLAADLPALNRRAYTQWDTAVKLETPHYTIITSTGMPMAYAIGDLMETVFLHTSSLLGPPRNGTQKLAVYAYPTQELYEERVRALGLPLNMTTGFYSPAPPAGIHLPLVETGGIHPFFTLIHEGVHQYVHEKLGLEIRTGEKVKLPPLPLWLNEGLALYLEAAMINDAHLQPGRIHPARLAHLQKLLRQNKAPAVTKVVSASYGEHFSNADYSVAWGLVQALQDHSSGLSWERFLTEWLSVSATRFASFRSGTIYQDQVACQQAWAEILGRQSTLIFRNEVLSDNLSWDAWQNDWQVYILQLTMEP